LQPRPFAPNIGRMRALARVAVATIPLVEVGCSKSIQINQTNGPANAPDAQSAGSSGAVDAGFMDASGPVDLGVVDTGSADAGTTAEDAGAADSGFPVDAGFAADADPADVSSAGDAGDGGLDAGLDAGTTPPAACHAVELDGTVGLTVPSLNGQVWGATLTIELWFWWENTGAHRFEPLLESGGEFGRSFSLTIIGQTDPNPGCLSSGEVGRLNAMIGTPAMGGACLQTPAPIGARQWHHVALTYASGRASLYLDGNLAASAPGQATIPTANEALGIGRNFYNAFAYRGRVDELRISSVARYTASFTPSERLGADADTLLLLHFDEGTGAMTRSADPTGRSVAITGATWTNASSCDGL
jgi:hypothetical protein